MKFASALAVAAVAAVSFATTAVIAQQNPIEQRKAIMKENGAQAKAGAAMAKGEAPFDLAKAKTIFATFADSAGKMPNLFPPDSKTGNETTAAPAIWEKKNEFNALFVKFGKDAKEAESKVTDLASFRTQFAAMGKQCGGCHETFRVKKN
jgi:cytochrome c556